MTGFTENGWIGLSMLHGLFAPEHNAICDRLKRDPAMAGWTDDQLFIKARLINTALMAKIHTIEWTPAILPHEVIEIALNTNWHGLVRSQRCRICSNSSATTNCSAASSARTPIITPRRIR